MTGFAASRLQVIAGRSCRLRDEALAQVLPGWSGPVRRVVEPDPRQVLVDIDTPSLFGEPSLWVVRADEPWLRKHHEQLAPLAGTPPVAGAVVLVVPELDGRTRLAKALGQAKALQDANPPWIGLRPSDATVACRGWVADRMAGHPAGVQRPGLVAERLVNHLGEDADALLAAIDVLCLYADEEAITPEQVERVVTGTAERPIWEFTGAVLSGDSAKALSLLDAGGEPQGAMAALLGEIRKGLAALETTDDGEASRRAGLKSRANLYHPRRQAQAIGQANLRRLLGGALQAQRQLRQAGKDHRLVIEMLVLHARQLVSAGKR